MREKTAAARSAATAGSRTPIAGRHASATSPYSSVVALLPR